MGEMHDGVKLDRMRKKRFAVIEREREKMNRRGDMGRRKMGHIYGVERNRK